MSGPAHSSVDTVEDEEEEEDPATTRYNPRPLVEGKPNSLAMLSSMEPMVG